MINANRVRAMNDKIDLMILMHPESINKGDAEYFPVRPSFEPRPASDDEFETKLGDDGALGIARKSDGPQRTQDAELVSVESDQSLCNACLSALGHLAKYLEEKLTVPNRYEKSDRLPPNVVLHWNLLALEDSRLSGCHLCSLISANVNPRYLSRLEIMQDCRVELVLSTSLNDADTPASESDGPEDTRLACCLTPNSAPERTNQTYWSIFKLRFWPSPTSDAFFPAQPSAGDDESARKLEVVPRGANTRCAKDMAVDWLDRCKRNHGGIHEACVTETSSWLPTRLVDLSNAKPGGMAKVVSTVEHAELFAASPSYITLSHCWGNYHESKLPRLLEENKITYQLEGIAFDELPPLVRDAMEIAQWFQVRWLWIDSLCIIQDSPNMSDWNHEALLMSKVYKYGLLNISADASDDAQGGCFRDRPQVKVTPFKIQVANLQKSWWVALDERNIFEWVTAAPLSRRAWVFQERQLARRALHFTKHEVFWECSAEDPYCACETYSAGSPFETRFSGVNKYEPSRLLAGDGKAKLQSWLDLCEDFSVKSLTFETDRLPALAGLAIDYATLFPGDTYAAGFWSSSLPGALLWLTPKPIKRRDGRDAYVVPSWSWLSLGSAVNFHVVAKTSPDFQHAISRVCGIHLTPLTPSPFGAIQPGGYIELEGFLRPIRIVRQPVSSDVDEADRWYLPSSTYRQFFYVDGNDRAYEDERVAAPSGPSFSYSLDFQAECDDEAKEDGKNTEEKATSEAEEWSGFCFSIALSRQVKDSELVLEALLLEKTDSDDTFVRAGHIRVSGSIILPLAFRIGSTVSDADITAAAKDMPGMTRRRRESSDTQPEEITKDLSQLRLGSDTAVKEDNEGGVTDPLSLYEFYPAPNDPSFEKLSCTKIRIM